MEDDSNFFSEDKTFSLGPDYKLKTSTSFSSNKENQYKPDANMIIISLFFNHPDSRSSSITYIRKSVGSNKSDSSINDNKNNVSMLDERKKNINLFDSLFEDSKKVNSSFLISKDDNNIENINDNNSINSIDKIDKDNKGLEVLENIFISDEEDSKPNSKKDSKTAGRKSYQIRTKRKFNFFFKNYKQPDCCKELYDLFNQHALLSKIKQNYSYLYSKILIERLKVPESRNFEADAQNFLKYMKKREKKKKESNFKYHRLLTIFLILSSLYLAFILIFINYDAFNDYIS